MRRPMSRLALRNRRLMLSGVMARAEVAAHHRAREDAVEAAPAPVAPDPDPHERAGWRPVSLEPFNPED